MFFKVNLINSSFSAAGRPEHPHTLSGMNHTGVCAGKVLWHIGTSQEMLKRSKVFGCAKAHSGVFGPFGSTLVLKCQGSAGIPSSSPGDRVRSSLLNLFFPAWSSSSCPCTFQDHCVPEHSCLPLCQQNAFPITHNGAASNLHLSNPFHVLCSGKISFILEDAKPWLSAFYWSQGTVQNREGTCLAGELRVRLLAWCFWLACLKYVSCTPWLGFPPHWVLRVCITFQILPSNSCNIFEWWISSAHICWRKQFWSFLFWPFTF